MLIFNDICSKISLSKNIDDSKMRRDNEYIYRLSLVTEMENREHGTPYAWHTETFVLQNKRTKMDMLGKIARKI